MKTGIHCRSWLVIVALIMAWGTTGNLSAQSTEIQAIVVIRDFTIISSDSLRMTLALARNGNQWQRWANGTFQFNISGVPASDITISRLPGTSDLDNSLYTVTPRVVTGVQFPQSLITKTRISITVRGPENFSDAAVIPADTNLAVRIGTFVLAAKSGSGFSDETYIEWLDPQEYYQALAYKIANPNSPWNGSNDNIEINSKAILVKGNTNPPDLPVTVVDCKGSTAEYLGSLKTRIVWKTTREQGNAGFVVFRAELPYGETSMGSVAFDTIVGSYVNRPELLGLGVSSTGKTYSFDDSVSKRGHAYCYKVVSMKDPSTVNLDKSGKEISCTLCTFVAFAVIVQATPSDNPFKERTTISYRVDDDVMLTAKVYDATGAEVETLIDNQFIKRGSHEVTWIAASYAVNGLYNVVLTATPLNDSSVELSRAVIKLELMR